MEINGFLNLLKPPGITSHDLVKSIRMLFPGVKVGHGGTLDPGAAGVLPVLLGRATRLSSYLLELNKFYRAELCLGITTDTEDSSGKILMRKEVPASLETEIIKNSLLSFEGELWQIPPMYAAIKNKGKKLYDYAREGITVEREPRKVMIYSIKFIDYFPSHRIMFDVECSKGTYIRTLCSQIGDYFGYGGHMSFLLRKSVGPLTLSLSKTLKEVEASVQNGTLQDILLPLDFIFQHFDPLFLGEKEIRSLCQGQHLFYETIASALNADKNEIVDETLMPVYTTKREFMLLARWVKKDNTYLMLKPEKVFK